MSAGRTFGRGCGSSHAAMCSWTTGASLHGTGKCDGEFMANNMIENDEVQVTAAGRSRGTTQPMMVVRPAAENAGVLPSVSSPHSHIPSYHPTRWPFVNRV